MQLKRRSGDAGTLVVRISDMEGVAGFPIEDTCKKTAHREGISEYIYTRTVQECDATEYRSYHVA